MDETSRDWNAADCLVDCPIRRTGSRRLSPDASVPIYVDLRRDRPSASRVSSRAVALRRVFAQGFEWREPRRGPVRQGCGTVSACDLLVGI